jgi:tetratricopeptide (TPR) repeat protein
VAAGESAVSVDRYQGFSFAAADLAEDVDLDVERRKEILFAEASLGRWTHWEVLGLPWNAAVADARAAYVDRVKVFHPDRYPGKRLGSYRARLERVFRALTAARDALADEARRAAYARTTAPPDEFARLEARRLEDERRQDERRARLARQNPQLARAGRVQELVRRGRAALAEGKFQAASNDLVLAQGLDPKNAELAAIAAEARKRAAGAKASELLQRGLEAELVGRHGAALEAYREALGHDPRNLRAAALGARAALVTGDLASARALAQAAVEVAPGAGIAHEALGLVLEAEGQRKEAKRALERALELDPRLERAKERLKKLRWSFLG